LRHRQVAAAAGEQQNCHRRLPRRRTRQRSYTPRCPAHPSASVGTLPRLLRRLRGFTATDVPPCLLFMPWADAVLLTPVVCWGVAAATILPSSGVLRPARVRRLRLGFLFSVLVERHAEGRAKRTVFVRLYNLPYNSKTVLLYRLLPVCLDDFGFGWWFASPPDS